MATKTKTKKTSKTSEAKKELARLVEATTEMADAGVDNQQAAGRAMILNQKTLLLIAKALVK